MEDSIAFFQESTLPQRHITVGIHSSRGAKYNQKVIDKVSATVNDLFGLAINLSVKVLDIRVRMLA